MTECDGYAVELGLSAIYPTKIIRDFKDSKLAMFDEEKGIKRLW